MFPSVIERKFLLDALRPNYGLPLAAHLRRSICLGVNGREERMTVKRAETPRELFMVSSSVLKHNPPL